MPLPGLKPGLLDRVEEQLVRLLTCPAHDGMVGGGVLDDLLKGPFRDAAGTRDDLVGLLLRDGQHDADPSTRLRRGRVGQLGLGVPTEAFALQRRLGRGRPGRHLARVPPQRVQVLLDLLGVVAPRHLAECRPFAVGSSVCPLVVGAHQREHPPGTTGSRYNRSRYNRVKVHPE